MCKFLIPKREEKKLFFEKGQVHLWPEARYKPG
jgi:hypothetical protein